MFTATKSALLMGAIAIAVMLLSIEITHGQMPLPVYTTQSPVFVVRRPILHHHRVNYVTAIPVQVSYPAYYAPQVPVVPVAAFPVPTVSAYYVPTVPVRQVYYAPVVSVRRLRRHSVVIAPVAVHPVYWSPY
jgi:hypothetical protein